jgi:Lipase (class 3)
MDLNKAILYGQLVNEAYGTPPSDLKNRAGEIVSGGLGSSKTEYTIITTIYANDLATQKNPLRAENQVSIGLILQEQGGGEAVIAFRGTEGIKEWVVDADFKTKPCPFLASAGTTEDGFTDMYESVAVGAAAGSLRLTEALVTLPWNPGLETLTICGHSLGGALATLAALDIAVNSTAPFHDPTVYTYASPRTGDVAFATKYNQIVTNTFRIANDLDVVPRLPLFPPYEHVLGDFAVKPFTWIPPKFLLQPNPVCEHILASYLYLLSVDAGGALLQPADACKPQAAFSDLIKEFELKWADLDQLKREFAASPGL